MKFDRRWRKLRIKFSKLVWKLRKLMRRNYGVEESDWVGIGVDWFDGRVGKFKEGIRFRMVIEFGSFIFRDFFLVLVGGV